MIDPQPVPGFGAIDWTIVGLYFLVTMALGIFITSRQKDSRDYLLGGRRIPVLAASISLVATSLSAVTFIGGPQDAYVGNLTYLSLNIGMILGIVIVATMFIPTYYARGVGTVYELVGQGRGGSAQAWTSGMFLLGRVFASGARLYVAAIPVSLLLFGDLSVSHMIASVIIVTIAAMFYSVGGGITAVIWTDVLQAVVLVSTAIIAMLILLWRIDLPMGDVLSFLSSATTSSGGSKLALVDTSTSLANPYTIWSATIGFTLFAVAAFGTDQDLAQRLLTCRSGRSGAISAVLSQLISIPVVLLFLSLGLLLFIYYQHPELVAHPSGHVIDDSRKVFLQFIFTELPTGVRGLMIAGVLAAAMSSLDSALAAMGSSIVTDFYVPRRPGASDRSRLRVARVASFSCGILLAAFACICVAWQNMLQEGLIPFALGVMVYAYAGLLAVFVTVLWTRRGSSLSIPAALVSGFIVVGVLQWGPRIHESMPVVSLGWRMTAGFVVALLVCLLGSAPRRSSEA